MGERIRLFSTGSFVSPTNPPLPKAISLNSFDEDCAAESTSRCPSYRSRRQIRRAIGSFTSLSNTAAMDVEKSAGAESAILVLPSTHVFPGGSSQLGMLCHHCSNADLTCPNTQKLEELRSPSIPSLYSLAQSDVSGEPLCRICHCCWPSDSSDRLISPCRCSGSLQYVHVSCLMHWLDISSRKLHRPAVCELCLYKYRRRRVLKYREMKMPQCADKDVRYYTMFVVAIVLMIMSALATVVCFQLEKTYGIQPNRTITQPVLEAVTGAAATVTLESDATARRRIGDIPSRDEFTRREDAENILSTITLVSAMLFFLSFFLAMYAHVKSGLSFCSYISLCWSSNLEWSIEEYKHSRDTQYLAKLEELRRKLNEKQKKMPLDEAAQPLRSSVVVLD